MHRERHRERVEAANIGFQVAAMMHRIKADLGRTMEDNLIGEGKPARTLNIAGETWYLVPGEIPDAQSLVYAVIK
jgi:hypothetical protein